MRIDVKAALTLAAVIRNDLAAIARIENHVSRLDLNTLSPAELNSLGYSMHNIYNALESCFTQAAWPKAGKLWRYRKYGTRCLDHLSL